MQPGFFFRKKDLREATSTAMDKMDGIFITVYKRLGESIEENGAPILSDIRDAATSEICQSGNEIVNE